MDEQSHPVTTTTTSELYPQARHHTYLPGIITPLLSNTPIHRNIHSNVDDSSLNISSGTHFAWQQPSQVQYNNELRPSWVQELAVLELAPDIGSDDDDNNNNNNTTIPHAAWQNSGNIVIFPGSVVPLRLLDQEWITYLQQQIQTITSSSSTTTSTKDDTTSTPTVRFGILMPRATNNNNENGDDDDDDDDDDTYDPHHFHASSIPEQRQSWTRQAHGPNTLRRLSDQLIQALGPNFDYDDSSDSDNADEEEDDDLDSRNLNSTMVAEPEATVALISATTTTNSVAEEIPQRRQNDRERIVSHRNGAVTWTLRRRQRQSSNGNDDDTFASRETVATVPITATTTTSINDTDMFRSSHTDEILHARQESRRSELRNRRREYQFMLEERREEWNRRRRRSQSLSSSNRNRNNKMVDRYIGRIGTIATVLYTHGDNDSHNNNNNNNARSASSSLVITAIGTSRFRIVGYRNDDEQNEYRNAHHRHQFNTSRRQRHGNLKHFLIDELKDVPMILPSQSHYQHLPMNNISGPTVASAECTAETCLKYYKNHLLHLSIVSPYPKYILQKMWPWKIMADICQYIQTVAPTLLSGFLLPSTTGELLQQLRHQQIQDRSQQYNENNDVSMNILDDEANNASSDNENAEKGLEVMFRSMDPSAFSYWMATNLPFRYEEKIHLLEICSTIERLQYISDKLLDEQLFAAKIHCIQCRSPLACTYDMFTVDGADGTTGNYVNEYGHVHQTITLRSIDDNGVWYQGEPQSQDSWFPGYCWTIMACAVCGHHLGWKFTLNNSDSANSPNLQRPSIFYGVSAANISTFVS